MNPIPQSMFFAAIVAAGCAVAAQAQQQAQSPPVEIAKLQVFKVPVESLHQCSDRDEASRRYKATKQMFSADIYIMTGSEKQFGLTPILREAVVHRIGGGSAPELISFGVDVTDSQKTKIDDAIQKKQLFIIYYHFGW